MDNENLEINNDIVEENAESVVEETISENETAEVVPSDEEKDVTVDSFEGTEASDEISEEEKPEKKYLIKNKIVREIVSWVGTVLIAIVVAILINTFFFRISTVSGDSMKQTYHDKEIVYLSRLPYIFGDIEKNEVVVFDSSFHKPEKEKNHRNFFTDIKEAFQYNIISYKLFGVEQTEDFYIKRVIAVAGDTIQIKEDGVYVNGTLLDEPYVNNEETPYYGNVSETLKNGLTVPDGHIFVMGDNRNNSADSRVIGCVPEEFVIGKVIGT